MTTSTEKSYLTWLIWLGAVLPPTLVLLLPQVNPGLDLTRFHRPDDMVVATAAGYSVFAQGLLSFAAYGLKQGYEIMALLMIIKLWRATAGEAVTLRRALTAFLAGELSCAGNYLFFAENSLSMEYLHSFGMLVCFAFIAYAILQILDARIVKYSDRHSKCALLFFCKYCYKTQPVPCTARKIHQLLLLALLLFCLLPFTGKSDGYFETANILGTRVILGHSLAQQVMETVLFPLVALLFLGTSLTVLLARKEAGFAMAKMTLAIGLGALGFSLLRFIIFRSFKYEPLWADVWEELTEFVFVAGSFYLLSLAASRQSLHKSQAPRQPGAG